MWRKQSRWGLLKYRLVRATWIATQRTYGARFTPCWIMAQSARSALHVRFVCWTCNYRKSCAKSTCSTERTYCGILNWQLRKTALQALSTRKKKRSCRARPMRVGSRNYHEAHIWRRARLSWTSVVGGIPKIGQGISWVISVPVPILILSPAVGKNPGKNRVKCEKKTYYVILCAFPPNYNFRSTYRVHAARSERLGAGQTHIVRVWAPCAL